MDYNHTLATGWEMALSKLPGNAKILLMILAFLNPDFIYESFVREGALQVNDTALKFITDEIEYVPHHSLYERTATDLKIVSWTLKNCCFREL